jgi:hypothetical protein
MVGKYPARHWPIAADPNANALTSRGFTAAVSGHAMLSKTCTGGERVKMKALYNFFLCIL